MYNARGVPRFLREDDHYERAKQSKNVSIIPDESPRRAASRPAGLIHSVSLYNVGAVTARRRHRILHRSLCANCVSLSRCRTTRRARLRASRKGFVARRRKLQNIYARERVVRLVVARIHICTTRDSLLTRETHFCSLEKLDRREQICYTDDTKFISSVDYRMKPLGEC